MQVLQQNYLKRKSELELYISQLQQELAFQDMNLNHQEEELRNSIQQEEAKLQKSVLQQEKSQGELEQIQQEILQIQKDYELKCQLYKTISGGVDMSKLDKDLIDQKTLIEDLEKQLTKLQNENSLLSDVV